MGSRITISRVRHHSYTWLLLAPGLSIIVGMVLNGFEFASADSTLSPTDRSPEVQVKLTMETRRFKPESITLRSGQKVRLVLENRDAELHAFVPIGLFIDTTLQISGNGSPEFGKEGFRRVLLPSNGQTEIVFIAQNAGSFPFLCDLPGHKMNGVIMVQDQ